MPPSRTPFFRSFQYIRYNSDLFDFGAMSLFSRLGSRPPRLVLAAPDVFRRGSSAKSDKYKDAPKMTL